MRLPLARHFPLGATGRAHACLLSYRSPIAQSPPCRRMHRGARGAAAARTLGRLSLRQAAAAHVPVASGSSDSGVAGSTLLPVRRLSGSVAEQASSPKGRADSGTKNLLWGTAAVATLASVVTAAATVAVMVRYIWRVGSKYVCVGGTQLDPTGLRTRCAHTCAPAHTRLQVRLRRLILRHSSAELGPGAESRAGPGSHAESPQRGGLVPSM